MSSDPDLLISCSKLAVSLFVVCSLHAGVGSPEGLRYDRNQTDRPGSITVFEGARLIVGDGSAAIENSAFIVENNRFIRIGRRGQLLAPTGAPRVDLTGKTVMPALVDAHVHLGYRMGLSFSADNYTRPNLPATLDPFARCGISSSLPAATGR